MAALRGGALRRQIETIVIHHLHPGCHEIMHEFLGIIVLGVNLGIGAEDRV